MSNRHDDLFGRRSKAWIPCGSISESNSKRLFNDSLCVVTVTHDPMKIVLVGNFSAQKTSLLIKWRVRPTPTCYASSEISLLIFKVGSESQTNNNHNYSLLKELNLARRVGEECTQFCRYEPLDRAQLPNGVMDSGPQPGAA
ncbi:hypothetical protein SLA2020_409980 [Shorea laevis]